MAMYAIADLHLQTGEERLLQAFTSFTEQLQPQDELYILGDLFNFFVGIDSKDIAHNLVKNVLDVAERRGIKAFFVHGNRDFLMTQKEAQWFHMQLLDDVVFRKWGTHTVVLAHGDLFCTNDKRFMAYHKKVSNPLLQSCFRCMPLFIRRRIAGKIRESSKNADQRRRDSSIYGVVDESVAKDCALVCPTQEKIEWVVHGHLHEFGLHMSQQSEFDWRYVLGAWWTHFSYLRFDTKRDMLDFRELPLDYLLKPEQYKTELDALFYTADVELR